MIRVLEGLVKADTSALMADPDLYPPGISNSKLLYLDPVWFRHWGELRAVSQNLWVLEYLQVASILNRK